ncbi:MAG: single-stranded DNA-binding protein [Pseudomonadota bacterium]|nr:single-stranded DNA-binding protein [Pseudomonadota bacterium]
MAAFITANGRLGSNPTTRTTASGKVVCNGSLAVTDASNTDETLWLKVTAWERQAEALGRYRSGDSLAVVGKLAMNSYTTKAGEERRELQITVDQIVGARPKPRRADDERDRAKSRPAPADAGAPFNDEILF